MLNRTRKRVGDRREREVGGGEAKGVSEILSAQWCLLPRLWYMSVCLIVSLGMRHSQDMFTVYGFIFCLLF